MDVVSSLQSIGAFAQVTQDGDGIVNPRVQVAQESETRSDLLRARSQLVRIFRSIEALAEAFNVQTRFQRGLPSATSSAPLLLDLSNTAARLASTDEINASPHSFSPFGPAWATGSSALISIGGEYDGSNGSGALSFDVRRPGVHGQDNLRVRVRDPQGSVISNVGIRANHDPDREYDLLNGLFLTLGSGNLLDDDTTAIQLFDNLGSTVDPNRPLGGIGNDNPNFQYYAAPNTLDPIVDGSFQLNGEAITVSTTDTLNTVVDRINQSNAGVTALFNAASERIEFVQDTLGSNATIDIQNDTSNFTTATKLDAAIVQPGIDPENVKLLEDVAAFSGIQSGSFSINGASVDVDTSTDSLTSIIEKINASESNVTASFDAESKKISLVTNNQNAIVETDSNGTALFAALNIPEGRIDQATGDRGYSRRKSYQISDAIESVFQELNAFFDDKTFVARNDGILASRAVIAAATKALTGEESGLSGGAFGINFDRSSEAQGIGRLADVDRLVFTKSLQLHGRDLKAMFAGQNENPGLINALSTAVGQALTQVSEQLGFTGKFVDVFA